MSRPRTDKARDTDELDVVDPAMATLRIAPIRSDVNALGSRTGFLTLPPLRTLEPDPVYYREAPRASVLERPRETQYHSHHPHDGRSGRRSPSSSNNTTLPHAAGRRSGAAGSFSSTKNQATRLRNPSPDIEAPEQHYTYQTHVVSLDRTAELAWREQARPTSLEHTSRLVSHQLSRSATVGIIDRSLELQTASSTSLQPPVAVQQRPQVWTLQMRQQPRAARACGFGERDRRVIDPPPMVELRSSDTGGWPLDISQVQDAFTIVHASLWNEEGTADCTSLIQPGRRPGGRLMGTLVASATIAIDDRNERGVFYAFPDLSCRSHGNYRLRFALMSIDLAGSNSGSTTQVIAQVTSDVFTVYTAKDFPGMRPSTPLTQALKRQGMAIPVKKGKQTKTDRNDNDDDDDDDDNG